MGDRSDERNGCAEIVRRRSAGFARRRLRLIWTGYRRAMRERRFGRCVRFLLKGFFNGNTKARRREEKRGGRHGNHK